jgi:selenocysteine lyase/cysteine desulfurase
LVCRMVNRAGQCTLALARCSSRLRMPLSTACWPHYYNTEAEIDRTVAAVAELASAGSRP